jgi:hypothetical protein
MSVVKEQAFGLLGACNTVLSGRAAYSDVDVRIAAHAVRILDAAKKLAPKDKLLEALEMERATWPVILTAMHAVVRALQD